MVCSYKLLLLLSVVYAQIYFCLGSKFMKGLLVGVSLGSGKGGFKGIDSDDSIKCSKCHSESTFSDPYALQYEGSELWPFMNNFVVHHIHIIKDERKQENGPLSLPLSDYDKIQYPESIPETTYTKEEENYDNNQEEEYGPEMDNNEKGLYSPQYDGPENIPDHESQHDVNNGDDYKKRASNYKPIKSAAPIKSLGTKLSTRFKQKSDGNVARSKSRKNPINSKLPKRTSYIPNESIIVPMFGMPHPRY